jgi:valyl-tRNA synthetase
MDDKGVMNENAGAYAGLDRFACRKKVVEDLPPRGLLDRIEDYQHAVGKCYRCTTVVEPTTSKQWFVSSSPWPTRRWPPWKRGESSSTPTPGTAPFTAGWRTSATGAFRQIWWGHRIPAWTCEECGKLIVEVEAPDVCPDCGSTRLRQENDVLDTWFSSALWPFSTLGWPANTKELATFYPTSVLITSFDILFFWVARMMMMGIHVMGEVPFRDVYLHALVRDKHGKKMSKSTGNVIDPLVMIEQYGTDAFRFTLTAFAAQGREIRMDEERIDGYRRFINKLWNAARFAQMHLKEADPGITALAADPKGLALAHRWILSRVNATIGEVRAALDNYNFNEVASASYQFVWHEFCDWYLEWIKADLFSADANLRDQARAVLLTVLEQVLKLMHPITPFVTEEIWSQLPGERSSIMVEPFPEVNPAWTDTGAETTMNLLMGVISGLRTIRTEAEVHPSAKIEATCICPDAANARFWPITLPASRPWSGPSSLVIEASGMVPDDAGHALVQDVELVVPLKGLIDVAGELEKLARGQGQAGKGTGADCWPSSATKNS